VCSHCGHAEHVFGADGGKKMAEANGIAHLGSLPLDMGIRVQADSGTPTVVNNPNGAIAATYKHIARQVALKIAQSGKDFSAKFPTITVSKGT
jgi:ATP-binding protein involved in chromosome partitioning